MKESDKSVKDSGGGLLSNAINSIWGYLEPLLTPVSYNLGELTGINWRLDPLGGASQIAAYDLDERFADVIIEFIEQFSANKTARDVATTFLINMVESHSAVMQGLEARLISDVEEQKKKALQREKGKAELVEAIKGFKGGALSESAKARIKAGWCKLNLDFFFLNAAKVEASKALGAIPQPKDDTGGAMTAGEAARLFLYGRVTKLMLYQIPKYLQSLGWVEKTPINEKQANAVFKFFMYARGWKFAMGLPGGRGFPILNASYIYKRMGDAYEHYPSREEVRNFCKGVIEGLKYQATHFPQNQAELEKRLLGLQAMITKQYGKIKSKATDIGSDPGGYASYFLEHLAAETALFVQFLWRDIPTRGQFKDLLSIASRNGAWDAAQEEEKVNSFIEWVMDSFWEKMPDEDLVLQSEMLTGYFETLYLHNDAQTIKSIMLKPGRTLKGARYHIRLDPPYKAKAGQDHSQDETKERRIDVSEKMGVITERLPQLGHVETLEAIKLLHQLFLGESLKTRKSYQAQGLKETFDALPPDEKEQLKQLFTLEGEYRNEKEIFAEYSLKEARYYLLTSCPPETDAEYKKRIEMVERIEVVMTLFPALGGMKIEKARGHIRELCSDVSDVAKLMLEGHEMFDSLSKPQISQVKRALNHIATYAGKSEYMESAEEARQKESNKRKREDSYEQIFYPARERGKKGGGRSSA